MFVTTVDVRDLARICEVRAVLEPEAARLAAERATQEDLNEIAALLEELDSGRRRSDRMLIDLDERIHRTIYRSAHNQFLEETLEEYYALALRIWVMALEQTHALRDAVEEHQGVLEAISRGMGDACRRPDAGARRALRGDDARSAGAPVKPDISVACQRHISGRPVPGQS